MSSRVRGRIQIHPRGFGFLKPEPSGDPAGEERPAAFVTPPDLNHFLEGDLVSATLVESEPGRFTATQLALVEHARAELLGTIVFHGGRPHLRTDRDLANTDWPFRHGEGAGLAEGACVVARVEGKELRLEREVVHEADQGLERCIVRHGLRGAFPEEVAACAEAMAKETLAALDAGAETASWPSAFGHRRDLRSIPTVTIDAASTRDIDDALAVLPAGPDGALRVLVSIADVDQFVPEGSVLDVDARERATSVYLAGRVLPMLPECLSSHAASLVEGADRLALTAELRIDPEGLVTSVDLYESVIRSTARLTYDAVAELLATGASADVPAEVVSTLRWLRTAAARLSAVRAARGGVSLHREEAYIALDEATRSPTAISGRTDTEAHRLVERLMVAANEAVAGWLVARGLPGIYRVHDEPTAERVLALGSYAHNFGIEAGFGPRLTLRGLAAFEAQFAGAAIAPAIRNVLGKALGPARYTALPGLHFGLGAPLYLHFTSPIRRYADLAVHRVVKHYLRGERGLRAGDERFALLGSHLDARARRASKAEAERHRMLVARYFASRVGEVVEGNIVAIKPFGLVVQMRGTGATGTIALDALPEGPYQPDAAMHALVGPGRRYSIGDPLRAVIASTSEALGRVELQLAREAG
ncbi:ribonuclease R family protein [Chondromyces crocatus]|uniref:Ribonuclease R n=1 Tax=Chondromyces crocatus TaxID=52 RepID=A0A0K1E8P9_CHOCO|nr:RNB domain-containing ribonuclease [Chondromyces crocatus]AKT36958.1 ribonuclease R [Chondromyces crocatus]